MSEVLFYSTKGRHSLHTLKKKFASHVSKEIIYFHFAQYDVSCCSYKAYATRCTYLSSVARLQRSNLFENKSIQKTQTMSLFVSKTRHNNQGTQWILADVGNWVITKENYSQIQIILGIDSS